VLALVVLIVFAAIEGVFFASSLTKFMHAGSKVDWYGLDTSTVITENVPMSFPAAQDSMVIQRKY